MPAGTDAGRYVGADRRGTPRRGLCRRCRGQPVPVGLWLDLHGAVRSRLSTGEPRRADLHPDAEAVRRGARARFHPFPRPAHGETERIAIVGGGPAGMSAAYYLARLGYPGCRLRGNARPGRHDGDRHPRVSTAPRGAPARRSRGSSASAWSFDSNAAMGRDFTLLDLEREGFAAVFLATGASSSRTLNVPGDDLPGSVPATLFLKRVNLGERPGSRPAWSSSAAGARLWMPPARPCAAAPRSSPCLSPRRDGHARAGRGGRGCRARGDRDPHRPRVREVIGREGLVVGCGAPDPSATTDREPSPPVPGRDESGMDSEMVVDVPDTRSSWPSARSPTPRSCRRDWHRDERRGRDRRRRGLTMATSQAGLRRRRRRVRGPQTMIDAVAAGRRAAGSIHDFLADVRDGEAAILRAVRFPTDTEERLALDLAPRARASRRSRSSTP